METPNFVIIPKGTLLSIVCRKGRKVCRTKTDADKCHGMAMDIGISVDRKKTLTGDHVLFLSTRGVNAIRVRHGWQAPKIKRSYIPVSDAQNRLNRAESMRTMALELLHEGGLDGKAKRDLEALVASW